MLPAPVRLPSGFARSCSRPPRWLRSPGAKRSGLRLYARYQRVVPGSGHRLGRRGGRLHGPAPPGSPLMHTGRPTGPCSRNFSGSPAARAISPRPAEHRAVGGWRELAKRLSPLSLLVAQKTLMAGGRPLTPLAESSHESIRDSRGAGIAGRIQCHSAGGGTAVASTRDDHAAGNSPQAGARSAVQAACPRTDRSRAGSGSAPRRAGGS